ncbi:MAG: FtsH protease activity modulator HflK [Synergistaceae bacterium]|nr:FtsH protease activity modulator HflK [Synergistaceae bacterium]
MAKVILMPDPDEPGLQEKIARFLMKHILWVVLLALAFLTLINNTYTIPSDSKGIVLRFGVIGGIVEPGLHFKIPYADKIYVVPTERKQSLEFGFRFNRAGGAGNRGNSVPVAGERLMLTRDNKLIEVEWVVHFHINVPEDYVFNLPNAPSEYRYNLPGIPPEKETILRDLCMAAMRRIFAASLFDEGLTIGKQKIQENALNSLQTTFNELRVGIKIDEVLLQETNVSDSIREEYNSVTTAEEQVKNMIYQAEAHANKVVPEAEGRAAVLINEGEAYKFKRISEAEGEAARLNLLQEAYQLNPQLTRLNMWADGMTDVWQKLKVVFVEGLDEAGGTLKVLPLPPDAIFQNLKGGETR